MSVSPASIPLPLLLQGWPQAEERVQRPGQGLLSLEELQLLLFCMLAGTYRSSPGCLPCQRNTTASRNTLTSAKYFGILIQKAREKRCMHNKISAGGPWCQYPLVTLRNDAVQPSSSSVLPKEVYFGNLRDNLSYLRWWMVSTYPTHKDLSSILLGLGREEMSGQDLLRVLHRVQGDFKGILWHRILTTTEPSLNSHP